MAIPSYGLGPERLFFPSPLTGSAALLPPTPPAAPAAPSGGSLLPALPPLPDPGGPPAGLEPPAPLTMAQIIAQDQGLRSWLGMGAQAVIPGGAFFGGLARNSLREQALAAMGQGPGGVGDIFRGAMPWSKSVQELVDAATWINPDTQRITRGNTAPAQTWVNPDTNQQWGGGQGGLPSLADLAASIAAGIAQFGDPGGGTDTASFGGLSSSDPGEAGGGGIW